MANYSSSPFYSIGSSRRGNSRKKDDREKNYANCREPFQKLFRRSRTGSIWCRFQKGWESSLEVAYNRNQDLLLFCRIGTSVRSKDVKSTTPGPGTYENYRIDVEIWQRLLFIHFLAQNRTTMCYWKEWKVKRIYRPQYYTWSRYI